MMVAGLLIGCGESALEGPERSRFEGVDEVTLGVDRGDVTIFAQAQEEGATVDRWHSGEGQFEQWELRQVGRELYAQAQCLGGVRCRSRFEMQVGSQSAIDVASYRGDVRVYRGEGPLRLRVEEGDVEVGGRSHSRVDLELGRGHGELRFEEAPNHLRLVLGVAASARVELPKQRYRCEFDESAAEFEGLDELRCHGHVHQGLEIVPQDAEVELVFGDD